MKKIKSKFYEYLSQEVVFTKDFSKISNSIDYAVKPNDSILEKLKRLLLIRRVGLVSIILLMLVISVSLFIDLEKDTIYLNQPDLVYNPLDINETISEFSYVFIAKVEKKSSVMQFDGTGTNIPYSIYEVSQILYFKGDGASSGEIVFYGGENSSGSLVLYEGVSELPELGVYYLILANKAKDNSSRVEAGQFIVSSGQYQIFELPDYDPTIDLEHQNNTIIEIIKPYVEISQMYSVLDQLGEYSTVNDLVADIAEITRQYTLNENIPLSLSLIVDPIAFLTTIVFSENIFLVFLSGSIEDDSAKVFIFKIDEINGNISLYRENESDSIYPKPYVFSVIAYKYSEEISYDSREITYINQASFYSFGFAIMNTSSEKQVYYNDTICDQQTISFNQDGNEYQMVFCYALASQSESRIFTFE